MNRPSWRVTSWARQRARAAARALGARALATWALAACALLASPPALGAVARAAASDDVGAAVAPDDALAAACPTAAPRVASAEPARTAPAPTDRSLAYPPHRHAASRYAAVPCARLRASAPGVRDTTDDRDRVPLARPNTRVPRMGTEEPPSHRRAR